MRLHWALGYSNEARAHRLAWPTSDHDPDAIWTPPLCNGTIPFGWLMMFGGKPDSTAFPACRVCEARAIRRRSAIAPRAPALRAGAGADPEEEGHAAAPAA